MGGRLTWISEIQRETQTTLDNERKNAWRNKHTIHIFITCMYMYLSHVTRHMHMYSCHVTRHMYCTCRKVEGDDFISLRTKRLELMLKHNIYIDQFKHTYRTHTR